MRVELPALSVRHCAVRENGELVEVPPVPVIQQDAILELVDRKNRRLGTLMVERLLGPWVEGTFYATPAFASVSALFDEATRAANDLLLVRVDEIDREIEQLGLAVRLEKGEANPIEDPDIWDRRIRFRLKL